MRRAGTLLFIALYVAATAGAAKERAIWVADRFVHATGPQEPKVESSKTDSLIGLPKFSHAKRIDTEAALPVALVEAGDPLLSFRNFQDPAFIDYSALDYDTSPARAPPITAITA